MSFALTAEMDNNMNTIENIKINLLNFNFNTPIFLIILNQKSHVVYNIIIYNVNNYIKVSKKKRKLVKRLIFEFGIFASVTYNK